MQLGGNDEHAALSADEFKNLMVAMDIGKAKHIAVAVSGGADSMALALHLKIYCDDNKIDLAALTVDHGLRHASQDETKQVKKWLADLGVKQEILTWVGDKPNANIQDEARRARYNLMGEWCSENNIKHLFLAHHQDDQAETFLIRLFRGSGIDGLSAMEKIAELPTQINNENLPKIYRPFLDLSKKRLENYLLAMSQEWISDPSNKNEKFTRVQIRNLLEKSDIEGMNAQRLASTANKMRRVRSLLEEMTAKAELDYVRYNELGYALLKNDFHLHLHEEISLRLLSNILRKIGGRDYAPRHQKLKYLFENLQMDAFSGQTLSGVMLSRVNEKESLFCREINDIEKEIKISKSQHLLWDKRFLLNVGEISGNVVPLSIEYVKIINNKIPDFKEKINTFFDDYRLRDRIVPSLPCIIDHEGRVILPDLLIRELKLTKIDGFSAVFKK